MESAHVSFKIKKFAACLDAFSMADWSKVLLFFIWDRRLCNNGP